jgi:antitoxin component YwqK of YwqJK toxin-antitoxin module
MTGQLNIRYKKDGAVFTVMLVSESQDIFTRSARHPEIRDKEGEDFVTAILAYAQGAISWIERRRNGQLNDGPNGEPARQMFTETGKINYKEYFVNDLPHDSSNGEPALQIFDDKGWLTRVENYKNGEKTKAWSEQEIRNYMHQLAAKNAGRPPPDSKKPGPAAGNPKIG